MPVNDLVARDTLGQLKATLVDQDTETVINLTGGSADLYIIFGSSYPVRKRAMTLTDAANGVVSYTFKQNDLVRPGAQPGDVYDVEMDVQGTDSSGNTVSISDLMKVRVRVPFARGTEALG